MAQKFVPPTSNGTAFNCPHCDAYAHQHWFTMGYTSPRTGWSSFDRTTMCQCSHCRRFSIWLDKKLIDPQGGNTPLPHPEMPDAVKDDYKEAQRVFGNSPRSSAALLRLVIQKLCEELGQKGENLNADIAALVAIGLPVQIQQALDIVRVVGNNQVHPGTLDVRDDPTIAAALFELVNAIVEDRISRPKQIDALYNKLPETARQAIEARNTKAVAKP
jgi:hypothetical protein